nr:MDIS1-interacting receptor like kinase 2-like [Tanacetum cinerariifolium]
MNLSHNKLSGSIPNGFSDLPKGIDIDMSYNELTGSVPPYAVFLNVSGEALQGNDGLCGNVTALKLCESQMIKKKNNQFHYTLILVTMVPVFTGCSEWFGLYAPNGLAYMHHDCTPPIIHRDISGANILLDSDYGAHISDFGTAKLLKLDSSNRTAVVGTYGYIAP